MCDRCHQIRELGQSVGGATSVRPQRYDWDEGAKGSLDELLILLAGAPPCACYSTHIEHITPRTVPHA